MIEYVIPRPQRASLPVKPGDEVTGSVEGVAEFSFTVGPRPAA